jgi:hypothetical protein
MKFEFYWHIFEKKTVKYQISWKSVVWEPSWFMRTDERRDGQTYKQDEANIRFRNFADANKDDIIVIWNICYHKFVIVIIWGYKQRLRPLLTMATDETDKPCSFLSHFADVSIWRQSGGYPPQNLSLISSQTK